ncbi:hypothetical protein ACUWC3_28035, partial [Klebsiella pneumoniae]|uniref:hypothetical protein n=1 Tax=Klebsiella pneumoniae TaxID=573 RepID=UPI0040555383
DLVQFLATILKVQLAKETGRKEMFPSERSFIECAQTMVDASAREEEMKRPEEDGWRRVTYKGPRNTGMSWKRRDPPATGDTL